MDHEKLKKDHLELRIKFLEQGLSKLTLQERLIEDTLKDKVETLEFSVYRHNKLFEAGIVIVLTNTIVSMFCFCKIIFK